MAGCATCLAHGCETRGMWRVSMTGVAGRAASKPPDPLALAMQRRRGPPCSRHVAMIEDRRRHPSLRLRFETLKADLLRRLANVSQTMRHAERDAMVSQMARRQIRYEYRHLLRG